MSARMRYRDKPAYIDGRRLCDGSYIFGAWQGNPCGATAQHQVGGRYFCDSHAAIARKQERMRAREKARAEGRSDE